MSDFDAIAGDFDRFRAFPAEVPAAIRRAMWDALGCGPGARVLDLGAGSGRIGEAFLAAGDSYFAVDRSGRMLARFAEKVRSRGGPVPPLVRADGGSLPFANAELDAVLLVQVLSGSPDWRRLLTEARRVLRPGGGLVLGQAIGPPEGLDARLRDQLGLILAGLGVDSRHPGARRHEVRAWLIPGAQRIDEVVAARWQATRSPHDFLARHSTGARFAALAQPVKDEALGRLADWAVTTFGSLDATQMELHTFMLDVYGF
jgi:SAM-dependent methyltransferase